MSSLSAADQTALCARIANVKRRGVLADWGYAVPMAEPATIIDSTIPTSQIAQPSQSEYESSNFVPVAPVNSKDAPTTLKSVSDLTNEDNIVLAMGPTSVESDLRHTIDTSPLHRMVRFTIPAYQTTQQLKLGNMVMDGGSACYGGRWAAGGS